MSDYEDRLVQELRDLAAWAMRLLEDKHEEHCPALEGDGEFDNAGACECVVAEFASRVLDLDIEPCARCDQREATQEVDGIPICAQCKQEVA